MKKLFVFILITACTAILCAGDTEAVFQKIEKKIDKGGSYYTIKNPAAVNRMLSQGFAQLEKFALQGAGLSEDQIKQASLIINTVKIVYELSGYQSIEGWGASSKFNEQSGFYRNRGFLAVEPGAQGFLVNMFGTENRDLATELSALPVNTIYAADVIVNAGEIVRSLKQAPQTYQQIDDLVPDMIIKQVEDVLNETEGEWGILVFADETPEQKIHFMLAMPDKNHRIYDLMKLKAIAVNDNGIVLSPRQSPHPKIDLEITADWTEGQLNIYSSPEAITALGSAQQKLIDSEDFKKLANGVDTNGLGFVYVGDIQTLLLDDLIGEDYDLSMLFPQIFGVYSRQKDGFEFIANSNMDLNQIEFFGMITSSVSNAAPALIEKYKNAAPATAETKYDNSNCLKNMEAIRTALLAYAAKNDGKFPEKSGFVGFEPLIKDFGLNPANVAENEETPYDGKGEFSADNCSYILFGGLTQKDNPKLPVVLDWPYNHDGTINVILVDGTIQTIQLDGTESCKRIVSVLHTQYKYSEADFTRLIQIANELDSLYEIN